MAPFGKFVGLRCCAIVLHATGLLVALLIIASSVFVYAAIENQRTRVQLEQYDAQKLFHDRSKVLDSHTQAKQQVSALESTVLKLRRMFPAHPDETGLLADISQLAERADVQIHNFHAGSIRSAATHKILEVSFRADGSYRGVCEFLASLGQIPRRVHISQLDIGAPATLEQPYTIDVQLRLAFGLTADSIQSGVSP